MSKSDNDIRLSPTPQYTSEALTQAIIETRKDTKFLREDLIPPLTKDAKEGRDKAREALTKVNTHMEDRDSHEHPCIEEKRQERQDTNIAETRDLKPKFATFSKVFWIVVSLIVAAISGAYGYTMTLSNSTTENATKLESHREFINRNENEIGSLEKAQQRDRETYLREVRALPASVQKVAQEQEPTLEDIEKVTDDLPLTDREREMMERIVKQAQKRASIQ